MSAEEKVAKRILSAGSAGVKKADLRKEFGDIEATVGELVNRGEAFVDKRGSAYYCFHKDHYIQSLLNSDPRFRITFDLIKSLEETVTDSSKETVQAVETLSGNISNLARLVASLQQQQGATAAALVSASAGVASRRATVSLADFKKEFDASLAGSSSSIGWVELARIRADVCERCGLSGDEFYRLVGELTGQYQDRYELSTGGGEGVTVRGLLHGFVRCI